MMRYSIFVTIGAVALLSIGVYSWDPVQKSLTGNDTAKGANARLWVKPSTVASSLNDLDPSQIPEKERLDGQPEELVAVLGHHQSEWGRAVRSVAFSPDGKWLASVHDDNVVRLWDMTKAQERFTLEGPENNPGMSPPGVAFSPDGRILVANSYFQVKLWNLSADEPRAWATLRGKPGSDIRQYMVAFHPISKRIAVANRGDMAIRFWDLTREQPKEESSAIEDQKGMFSIAFTPDGKMLAVNRQDSTVAILLVCNSSYLVKRETREISEARELTPTD